MIELILKHFFPNFILVSSMVYIWHKLSDKKINFKDYKLYLTIFCIMILSVVNYLFVEKYIRIILVTFIFIIFYRYLFKETANKCFVTPIYYQLIIMMSEFIYAIIINILKIDINVIMNSIFANMISNISIAIISLFLSNLKFVINLYERILTFTTKAKHVQLLLISVFLMLIANIFSMSIYYKVNFIYLLFFNISVILFCCVLIFFFFKTQNKYKEVSDKYNIAINSLRDYESMMNKYRIANHENKNLLSTIRVMVENNEKDIPKYIDSIIEKKYAPDDKLLFETSVIPSGGLRATIYSELVKIKDHNINYNLRIDKRISTVDLIELPADTLIDMCKIICVYIDNAIEEVEKQKDGIIEIEMFCDDDLLNIKVSNSYRKKIDLNKISQVGYTTKGKGHGYGLSLVKQILDSNKSITSQTEINKDIFSQNIKVKIKK